MTGSQEPADTGEPKYSILDIGRIIRQLEDLVKLSLECENKELRPGVSFVEVNKKLMNIRKDIERFQENYQRHLAQLNLKPEDMRPKPEEVAALPRADREVFEKLQGLLMTCEDAKERIHESLQANQEAYKELKSELRDKSKDKIHRKGKFKGVGGKSGWIPT